VRAIVFGSRPGDTDRSGRTARALRLHGASVADLAHELWLEVFRRIRQTREPVWLVRAGAWPKAAFTEPPPSATGRPVLALGAVEAAEEGERESASSASAWSEAVRAARGDFGPESLPPLVSVWLDAAVVSALEDEDDLKASLRRAAATTSARVAHYPGLDVKDDDTLRIAEVVTSAQQGGAERIALDLARGLVRHGLRPRLVTLGRPTRKAFGVPEGSLDLSSVRGSDEGRRARTAARLLVAEGFDLVHGHLLDHEIVQAFGARSLPMALTLHNSSAAWPAGTKKLTRAQTPLLIACAQAVERELTAKGPAIPVRTVWNGIDFRAMEADASARLRAREWREALGFGVSDFVLLALANPRPQKRLHLLPAILEATRAEVAASGWKRETRLVIAGAPSASSPTAEASVRLLEEEIERRGMREHVRRIGSVEDVGACLHGSDALVSASGYEGLSLAQIEAVAAGKPIVVTNVGGASELHAGNPAVFLVDAGASPAEFARVLAPLAAGPAPRGCDEARRDFDAARTSEGYARLLPRALRAFCRRGQGEGLFLVTNNFSVGGAQTSARRLLLALHGQGLPVRAAVIEEQPAFPTPGRRSLRAAGIEVLAISPPGEGDAAAAVSDLLDHIDRARPKAVLLWNVIPEHKILIADSLIDIPVHDVSPGEMYFDSLDRYFARPRPGLPYRSTADYGRRLASVIVKYEGERERAARALGAPVRVIPNGVPLFTDVPPAPPRVSVVIGTAVRLDPRKHVDRLLRALRRVHGRMPRYVLRIAGGPEPGCAAYADDLRALAADLPVEFLGEIADTREFLRGLDLFALVAEPAGCPNASLEAMAEGLPVIATDAGGMSEQVADGVTGRLVGRHDEGALGEALLQLAHDAPARKTMGKAGRARAEAHFSLARMVERYAEACLR
jgi:glycosyltransferase involved in cell wall biosynthesis